MSQSFYCRWSPTLGELEDTHQNVWGTKDYDPQLHTEEPVVFFGVYGLPDFYTLWRHKGKKYILWAGTDIIHLKNGYWLDGEGDIRVPPKQLARWINKNCFNFVENKVEQAELAKLGIGSSVIPSFLGDVSKFEISFKPGNKLYTSVSGDNFKQYGWHLIPELARGNPNIEFHLYGNSMAFMVQDNPTNVIIHGRVPKEQMNEEIKEMQGALRLTQFDGFSEILAKSILWGQWPISLIDYPYMLGVDNIQAILNKTEPNKEGRKYYQMILNKYPWI